MMAEKYYRHKQGNPLLDPSLLFLAYLRKYDLPSKFKVQNGGYGDGIYLY